jgi:hypothetical protein
MIWMMYSSRQAHILLRQTANALTPNEIFTFKVEDPTVNGSLNLRAVCYNETKFRLEVSCATWGMQPAKRNAISFCDGDPTKPRAIKLEITFLLPGFLFHSYT